MARPPHSLSAGPLRCLSVAGLALGVLGLAATQVDAASAGLAAQREGVRALEVQLAGLDARAVEARADEREAARRLDAARERLRRNAAELRRAAANHRTAQRLLGKRLAAIYREDRPDFVEILLTSGGLSQALDGVESLERVGRQDAMLIRGLRVTQSRLREARVAYQEQRRTAQADLGEALARRRQTEVLVSRRRGVLIAARARLDAMIAQEARQRAAAQRAARLAALRAARNGLAARLVSPTEDPPPAQAPADAGPTDAGPTDAVLERIAQCESGGDPRAVSGSGLYRGKYQFDPATWRSVGGSGDPADAPEAEQDLRAGRLYAQRGSAPWPVCGRR